MPSLVQYGASIRLMLPSVSGRICLGCTGRGRVVQAPCGYDCYSGGLCAMRVGGSWIDKCELKGCDDQDIMNRYYFDEGVMWTPKSGMSENEQNFNRTGVIYSGISEMDGLKISVFYDGLVFRGNQPKFCDKGDLRMPNLWIYLPQAEKDGGSKMEMLVEYKQCFTEEIREEYLS